MSTNYKKNKRKKERHERRASMEQKIDMLSNALQNMQDIILKQGVIKEGDNNGKTTKSNRRDSGMNNSDDDSDTTIYRNAVPQQQEVTAEHDGQIQVNVDEEISFKMKEKRDSSLSEDRIDTSNELIELDQNANYAHSQFIADCEAIARKSQVNPLVPVPMDEGERVIHEVEVAKVRLYGTSGNNAGKFNAWGVSSSTGQVALSAAIDENYMVIGSHVDHALQLKIINSKYVDFSKLIPKNKLNKDEDHRMELVSKGGYTYFLLVSDRDRNIWFWSLEASV